MLRQNYLPGFMKSRDNDGSEERTLISLSNRIGNSLRDGARMFLAYLLMASLFVPVHAAGSDDESDTATEDGRVAKQRPHTPSQNDTEEVSLHTAESTATPDSRSETADVAPSLKKVLKKKKKTKREPLDANPSTSTPPSASTPSSLTSSTEVVADEKRGVEITIDVGALVDEQKSPNLQTEVPDTFEDNCLRIIWGGMAAFRGLTTILSQVANVVSLHYSELTTNPPVDPMVATSILTTMMTTMADTSSTSMGMMAPDPMALTKYYGLVSVIAGGSSTVIQGLANVAANTEKRVQASLTELIKEYDEREEALFQKVPENKRHQAAFTLHLDDPDEEDPQPIQHTKKASNFMSRLNGFLIRFYGLVDGFVDWTSWGCNTAGWIITAYLTYDETLTADQRTNLLSASTALRSTGIVMQCLPALIATEKSRLREELDKINNDIDRLNKSETRKKRLVQEAEDLKKNQNRKSNPSERRRSARAAAEQ